MELPEAGGVAWTEVWTTDGIKVNLTSRAQTPAVAIKNLLAAIEETGVLTVRPAVNVPQRNDSPPDPFPFDEPPYEHVPQPSKPAQSAVPTTGQDFGLLEYAPKASETKPGDVFEIVVNEYKAEPKKISFWRKGAQYPSFVYNMTTDYAIGKFMELFKGWEPAEDGEHHDINPPIILTIVTSDKANKNRNYYRNLEAVRRQSEEGGR